ncbi:MAG: hypothetical protein J5998_04150, partial [Clostridia bacterium]|nr:hypothetical protein [Clostridia bacterium]
MKRLLATALVLVSVFALCACGEAAVEEKIETPAEVEAPVEEVPAIPDEYLKYQELVDALEAKDYDAATAFVDALEPEPVLPPVEEVEITTENFLDYFEYVQLPENNFWTESDSAGNVTAITFQSGYYLKDGYTVAPERAYDCSVEAGMKYDICWYYNNKKITVDLENHTYSTSWKPSDRDTMHSDKMCVGTYRGGDQPFYYIGLSGTRLAAGKDSSCLVPEENITLVSASGTLFLRGEDAAAIEKEEETAAEVPAKVPVDVSTLPEEYQRHLDVIDALEAEDYAAARGVIEALRPAPPVPPTVGVDITTENFLDYFEFVEIPENNYRVERLSSGEPAAIFAYSGFYLKDEYEVDKAHSEACNVTAKVRYKDYLLQYDDLDIDFDNMTYEVLVPLDIEHCTVQLREETL